jgi:hypothetical protein
MNIKELMAKRAQLGNKGNDAIFKPAEGDTVLRIVPLKSNPENPFQELYFHYLGKKTFLSPMTFGERDPIAEFSDGLVAAGNLSKDEYKEAKKFSPVLRTYLPVVVRGKESEGVKFWAFGKQIYTAILDIIADPDYGDISNPDTGHDIRITFTPAEKSPTKFADTKINVRPKPSKLTEDPALLNKLLTEQPNLLDCWPKQSYTDLKNALDVHLGVDEWATPVSRTAAEQAPAAHPKLDAEVRAGGSAAPVVSKSVEDEFASIYNS